MWSSGWSLVWGSTLWLVILRFTYLSAILRFVGSCLLRLNWCCMMLFDWTLSQVTGMVGSVQAAEHSKWGLRCYSEMALSSRGESPRCCTKRLPLKASFTRANLGFLTLLNWREKTSNFTHLIRVLEGTTTTNKLKLVWQQLNRFVHFHDQTACKPWEDTRTHWTSTWHMRILLMGATLVG